MNSYKLDTEYGSYRGMDKRYFNWEGEYGGRRLRKDITNTSKR